MVASASAQIEATAGARIRDPVTGKPAYGKVSAILIAVAAAVLILCCLVGAEDHGANFEKGRAAFEQDAGLDIGELKGSGEETDMPQLRTRTGRPPSPSRTGMTTRSRSTTRNTRSRYKLSWFRRN